MGCCFLNKNMSIVEKGHKTRLLMDKKSLASSACGPLLKHLITKQQAEIIVLNEMSLANRSKHEHHFYGRRIGIFL